MEKVKAVFQDLGTEYKLNFLSMQNFKALFRADVDVNVKHALIHSSQA